MHSYTTRESAFQVGGTLGGLMDELLKEFVIVKLESQYRK
jgi:hypothetical protein